METLWPGRLPADPAAALQTQVSRLRGFLREMDPSADVVLEPGGYRVIGDGVEVDAWTFVALVEEARGASSAGAALASLDRALELWRGPAFEGLEAAGALDAAAARLREVRSSAEERKVECLLALGRVAEAREACEPLVVGDPLRERPRALYWSKSCPASRAMRDAFCNTCVESIINLSFCGGWSDKYSRLNRIQRHHSR